MSVPMTVQSSVTMRGSIRIEMRLSEAGLRVMRDMCRAYLNRMVTVGQRDRDRRLGEMSEFFVLLVDRIVLFCALLYSLVRQT